MDVVVVITPVGVYLSEAEDGKRINEEQEKETIGDKVSSLSRPHSTRPCRLHDILNVPLITKQRGECVLAYQPTYVHLS